jgi:hypothetical protein
MTDVLRRVAMVHMERQEKADKKRLLAKRKLAAKMAYFKDSGIPEMWEDIKDIRIANPAKDKIEGFTVTFADLVIPTCADVVEGTGLSLYDKNDAEVMWYVQDESDTQSEQPVLVYTHNGSRHQDSVHIHVEQDGAKQKFVESFIKWLAKHLTPQMLAEMDIDMTPASSTTKKPRKFLQVAQ